MAMTEREFIETMLTEAAAQVRDLYRRRHDLSIQHKQGPMDFVTAGDLQIQQYIHHAIAKMYPGDRLVAEEQGLDVAPDDRDQRCWVLDPIDGTHNFVVGLMPTFGVSLALVERGRPITGGVALPMLDQLLIAERGAGAWRDGQRLHVANHQVLEEAKIEIDFSRLANRQFVLTRGRAIIETAGQIRSQGSAVVGLCAVATGDGDGYVHPSLKPWDYAASLLIITEAGGTVSRLDGAEVHIFDGKDGILAANPALHARMLELLN
jgi:myo-inositol-1(or 4)-monophosphatase